MSTRNISSHTRKPTLDATDEASSAPTLKNTDKHVSQAMRESIASPDFTRPSAPDSESAWHAALAAAHDAKNRLIALGRYRLHGAFGEAIRTSTLLQGGFEDGLTNSLETCIISRGVLGALMLQIANEEAVSIGEGCAGNVFFIWIGALVDEVESAGSRGPCSFRSLPILQDEAFNQGHHLGPPPTGTSASGVSFDNEFQASIYAPSSSYWISSSSRPLPGLGGSLRQLRGPEQHTGASAAQHSVNPSNARSLPTFTFQRAQTEKDCSGDFSVNLSLSFTLENSLGLPPSTPRRPLLTARKHPRTPSHLRFDSQDGSPTTSEIFRDL
ncbi:hypothetical protein FB45DRAFT_945702, partial [Roridomyces roridus]